LTHFARDQLRVLCAKVEDNDSFRGDGRHWRLNGSVATDFLLTLPDFLIELLALALGLQSGCNQ